MPFGPSRLVMVSPDNGGEQKVRTSCKGTRRYERAQLWSPAGSVKTSPRVLRRFTPSLCQVEKVGIVTIRRELLCGGMRKRAAVFVAEW